MSIADHIVKIRFNKSEWEPWKRDDSVAREAEDTNNADRGTVHVRKRVMDCAEHRAILTAGGHIYNNIYIPRTCPWEDRGARIIRGDRVMELMELMNEAINNIEQSLIPAFIDVYEERWEQQRFALGAMFSEDDYPAPYDIRAKFSYRVSYEPMADIEALRRFGATFSEEDIQNAQRAVEDRLTVASKDKWEKLAQPLSYMINKLSELAGMEDIKGKRIHDTLVTNLTGFLDMADAINFDNDEVFAKVVADARATLGGFTTTQFKQDPAAREAALAQAKRIAKSVAGYL